MKKSGFTLSEVLITLSIVGIIAALTIPALITKIQDAQINNQFKKALNTVNNALLKVRAELGSYQDCYYSKDLTIDKSTECIAFFIELKKQLNIAKDCTSNAYPNGCIPYYNGGAPEGDPSCGGFSQSNILYSNPAYVLADGTIISQYGTHTALIMMDVNGQKPPNKWGYDVFDFVLVGNNDGLFFRPNGCYHPETGGKPMAQMIKDVFK